MERKGLITFMGNPLTLEGNEIKTGDSAPDFTVLNAELQPVHLSDFGDAVKVISVTPSLDTPVCDMQARRFNQEAANLPGNVVLLNMSVDLPFAIARFCAAAGIDKVKALSDHRDLSFGSAYGVVIKELRLLTRAIFVIDGTNRVRHVEIVPEITNPPDYDKALGVIKTLQ